MILLLVGCADLLFDQIKDGYTADPPRLATGAVWPPMAEDDAPEARVVGGTATRRVSHDGLYWTFDVAWNFSFFDEAGAPLEGVESQITLGWEEWAGAEGEVYRFVEPFTCEPGAAGAAVEAARLVTVIDSTAQAGETDPDGVRLGAAEELLGGQAGRWSGFGLVAYADGSPCLSSDVEVLTVDGEAFPADATAWGDTLAGLAGCELGARHYLFDAVSAAAAAAGEDAAIVVYAADGDAGSAAEPGALAASAPPVFEVRADDASDVVDEVLVAQGSGGAVVIAPEDGTAAAFDAVGTMLTGGAGSYVCTGRLEIEMVDEARTPAWVEAYAYLPPSGTRVQVSVPWVLGFSSLGEP